MSGISRGGGSGNAPRPPSAPDSKGPISSTDAEGAARPEGKPAEKSSAGPAHVDSFDASPRPLPAHVESKLQALAGKAAAGKIQFTNKDLEYLAQTFAAIVSQNPGASRRKRARLFAKAILKQRRLRKLFAGASENELETMYDVIGEQLDDSPGLAQLVDDVTAGAGKYGS